MMSKRAPGLGVRFARYERATWSSPVSAAGYPVPLDWKKILCEPAQNEE